MGREYWHAAFCGATEWELKGNKADLEFESEHVLNKEPIKMDMLVIKKHPNVTIQNEIGRIFRGHNVVEFKGSGDALNVDVYHKIIGYACLYKSMGSHVNERAANDITVTMIREAYPRELIKSLETTGINVTEQYPGIYCLSGNVMFPTQIIVTRRLNSDHASLRNLSKKAQEADVRSFLQEARIAKPETVEELNRLYEVWMQECYLNVPHSALNGRTPHDCYEADSHDLRLLPAEQIADAFLSCEQRKVDKGGCISFCGRKYEVELGLSMICRKVDVVYDPANISVLTIECEGFPPCNAKPLVIASHSAQRPTLPERFEKTEPVSSRLLDAAAKKNLERHVIRRTAISFTSMQGGGKDV